MQNGTLEIQQVEHFDGTGGNRLLAALLTGALGAPANTGPRLMRLTDGQASDVGLEPGSGTPHVAYGFVNGQFRATAIRSRHTYIEPIKRAAKAAWIERWEPAQ